MRYRNKTRPGSADRRREAVCAARVTWGGSQGDNDSTHDSPASRALDPHLRR
jgi:hypothetical protein